MATTKQARKAKGIITVLGGYKVDLDNHGRLIRSTVNIHKVGDYGCDPLGDGMFRMVPSGDIVTAQEKNARLAR